MTRVDAGHGTADPISVGLREWPEPLAEEAYQGLAGEIVHAIEPETEADPVAILGHLLVCFGNVVGPQPHFAVEADRHPMNVFAIFVGPTGAGRKGTALGYARRIFHEIDPAWEQNQIQQGLSSGEGLIFHVRDPAGQDPGVDDKRLLAAETEFGSPLRIMERDGNTLSGTVRQAWDAGPLRILSKNSPAVATGAHVSILGHISIDEVRYRLNHIEVANGFANRFLWFCVRRSQSLPDGGAVGDSLHPLIDRLRASVEFARTVGALHRDDDARALWHERYSALSEGRPGLYGAITARAAAQVTRLQCIYALIDRSAIVTVEHLKAALAVWQYVEDSVRCTFGSALGDPIADRILSELRNNSLGLSRTAIRDLFQRHAKEQDVTRALNLLASPELVRKEMTTTGGRPVETWYAILTPTKGNR